MAATLRASQKGLKTVELARKKKGWNADALSWYSAADVCLSTLKRFRQGIPIQQPAFINICKAVGIDNWEDIVDESEMSYSESDSGGDIDLATWQEERHYGQFVGRTDELKEILKLLESEKKIKVLSIVGIGGLGKTALCHQLSDQAYQAKVFTKIVWVRAKIYQYQTNSLGKSQSQRESKLTFKDALTAIGEELKIRNCYLQESDRLKKEIYNVLNKNRHLIVIDGLEDTESPTILANQLQSILGQSFLILTSRKQPDADIVRYQIRKLNPETSKKFIEVVANEKYMPSQNPIKNFTGKQLQQIIRITDGMPLAMKLTVSQASFLDIDRIIERLGSVSEEQELYDYLFEDYWNELEQENDFNTQKLLLYLSHDDFYEPTSIRLLYDLEEYLKQGDIDRSIEKLMSLSLVDIVFVKGGKKQVSLHSFTARYFGETLRKKYEK